MVDFARAPELESLLFSEAVSKKLGSRTRILSFCRDCQQKSCVENENLSFLLRLSTKSYVSEQES